METWICENVGEKLYPVLSGGFAVSAVELKNASVLAVRLILSSAPVSKTWINSDIFSLFKRKGL